ncbi:amidase [Aquabacterium sp.]|uniref:amidase n=1 Tax=Aquabacterium sp. TaxID=1872578 RepID=UPI003784754C
MDIQVNPRSIAAGFPSAAEALRAALQAADGEACRNVFIRRFDRSAEAAASMIDTARAAGLPLGPLAGMPVSIKDLFDVAGQPTTAASRAMADARPAARDCTAVARLRAAGAVLVGHTNMSEFAFSGVGINPHHGTPRNPCAPSGEALIPGGSTSGGAVAVAAGACRAALGSDTGGSIRIPAALQGLVGFKNTQRLTPLDGSIPLSGTLDTACAVTRDVQDAVLLHGVLAARQPTLSARPLAAMRFGVPATVMLDGLAPAVAARFEQALATLSRAGARIESLPLAPLAELANLQAQGGFAAAESWAWHRQRLAAREADYDPRVALRIRRGAQISAADYIDLLQARRDWIARIEHAVRGFDAMLSPTVPMQAPALQPLLDSDEAFFRTNALLLRNPSAINMLDGCALSLPCQAPDQLPIGLMVWGPALADDAVLDASLAIEAALHASAGA